jgi:hypothetical protein
VKKGWVNAPENLAPQVGQWCWKITVFCCIDENGKASDIGIMLENEL